MSSDEVPLKLTLSGAMIGIIFILCKILLIFFDKNFLLPFLTGMLESLGVLNCL